MGESEAVPLSAFVLMPFDADFEGVFSDLIAAPLMAIGFRVQRADSLLNQQNILADVISGIANADLIIADVTGLNPNVMYELGLAHALGKRTVMITQAIGSLPFDLRPYRANEYSTNFTKAMDLKKTLTAIGEAVVAGTADFGNPVQDFAPTAMDATPQVQIAPRGTRSPETPARVDKEDDDESDRGELGLIDALELLQHSAENFRETSDALNEKTTGIGDRFSANSSRLSQIRKNLGENRSIQPSKMVMLDMAKDLEQFSEELGPINAKLEADLSGAVRAANAIARYRSLEQNNDLDVVEGELASVETIGETLVQSYIATSGFATELASMPPMQTDLTKAARRAAETVGNTAAIIENAQAEFSRVEALLRERVVRS